MSHETLALETQLLLQEVAQATQQFDLQAVVERGEAPISEYEAAKQALLEKLKKKKEANRMQRQQLNQRRYGFGTPSTTAEKTTPPISQPTARLTPVKAKAILKLPVASTVGVPSRKKQDMLSKLRTQAIQQGAQNMAKLFGYASYEEQLKHLNKIEKMKILQDELKEKQSAGVIPEHEEEEEVEDDDDEVVAAHDNSEETTPVTSDSIVKNHLSISPAVAHTDIGDAKEADTEQADDVEMADETSSSQIQTQVGSSSSKKLRTWSLDSDNEEVPTRTIVKRRNQVKIDEDDGNDADSEQDDHNEEMAVDDDDMKAREESIHTKDDKADKSPTNRTDRAAAYRELLKAEAMQNRRRKRLVKGSSNFVESEAEEDEEEDVLKIGGLGDFGFGVSQAKTQESKDAEEERNALKLREDDLDGIVDELSDDEREQQQDLEELFRRELEDQDRQQVKEVMRNVKEGFGRNRRAFSSSLHMGEARGRFNLDELVAADGSKLEAARLGLLESDEEMSDVEEGKKRRKQDEEEGGDEEGKEEEDEEEEMERMLRARYLNQPKIYISSSESEDEDETDQANQEAGVDGNEVESDEERERQQMKIFSERARINRRMQRMKEMQRQLAVESQESEQPAKTVAQMPNLLLEEDEDSQTLLKLLNRTDVAKPGIDGVAASTFQKKPITEQSTRPKLGRFNSYSITSSSRLSSSFSRVVDNCKMFSANVGASSKGFVFTSFSSDKAEQGDENANPDHDDALSPTRSHAILEKSKSWNSTIGKKRPALSTANDKKKQQRSSGFFSVLSSYQCVSSTTANNNSNNSTSNAPM